MTKTQKFLSRRAPRAAVRTAATVGLVALMASPALAGTDTTFGSAVTQVTGWLEGSLGVLIALAGVGFGMFSLFQRNWAGAFLGVALALIGSIGPGIVTGIFTGVI